jgi:hypothetical protein
MTDATKLAQQYEDLLESILELALRFLGTLRFNLDDPQQLYSVCLYSRLLELAYASKALMEKNALAGIPVLLRSMFEADIDLTNLMKCRDYWKRMDATFLEQKLRLTKEVVSTRPNEFLTEIKRHHDFKKDLKKTQKQLNSYRGTKNGPISIRRRAELAGKLDEYLTVYNLLCQDTHNNIRSLENWHIKSNTPGEYCVATSKLAKSDLIHCLSAIPIILFAQTKSLAEFLGTEGIEFDRYSLEIENLRQAAIKSVQEAWANKPDAATTNSRACSRR